MNKFITLIGAVLLLSACATDPIQVNTISSPPPEFNPVMPSQIVTVPVVWTVLTQNQIQQLAKTNDPHVVFYSLDPSNMENLSVNIADIQRYMQDQKLLILSYQDYYNGLKTQQTPAK
jgi:uncharacterized lipoprotein YajG